MAITTAAIYTIEARGEAKMQETKRRVYSRKMQGLLDHRTTFRDYDTEEDIRRAGRSTQPRTTRPSAAGSAVSSYSLLLCLGARLRRLHEIDTPSPSLPKSTSSRTLEDLRQHTPRRTKTPCCLHSSARLMVMNHSNLCRQHSRRRSRY
jgi:hypothetical protein